MVSQESTEVDSSKFEGVSMVCQGSFKVFQECFKKVLFCNFVFRLQSSQLSE